MKSKLFASMTVIAVMFGASAANAQSDLSLRNDYRAGLTLPELDVGGDRVGFLESAAPSTAPSWTFDFELGAAYTDNAGSTPDDEQDATYIGPAATVTYKRPNTLGAWTLKTSLGVNTSYYTDDDSEFDEAVGVWDIQLAHALREHESVSFFHRSTAFFDGDFDNQAGSQRDFGVGYARQYGASQQTTVQALLFYQDASHNGDRTVVRGNVSHEFSQKPLGATWAIAQRLQYSTYRDDDRDDVLLSRTTFGPTWEIGGGELSLTASYSHVFSDEDDVSAFEIGPTFTLSF